MEYPGAIYHVTSRGNAQITIYADDADRGRFLQTLAEVVAKHHWLCHAYCLMGNHYHLLIETPEGNLSTGMRQLNGVYTQGFNRRHACVGHLFQGRYKAILVDRDPYLLVLCRYVVLNPLRAGMVAEPGAYVWSSHRATVGTEPRPEFLTTDWLLGQFSSDQRDAQARYMRFVMDGMKQPSPWREVKAQVLLGHETFVETMRPYLDQSRELREVSRAQRFLDRPPLAHLFEGLAGWRRTERDQQICEAHLAYGYSLTEIGDYLRLHYSTISKIMKRCR
ncbi:MAG: transposase [bacterium]|nr:transposase [bacterium]